MSITDARAQFKQVVDDLDQTTVHLIRHSRPVAVLMSQQRYEGLLSQIEDLQDSVASTILPYKLNPDTMSSPRCPPPAEEILDNIQTEADADDA
jgi:prevent-host-death family protein